MQRAIFKSQLLRANSQPELKAMTLALEPLLNLSSIENAYRGIEIGEGLSIITNIVTQFNEDGFLLMDNGFKVLLSLFTFNTVQKIAIAATTLYVLKHLVMVVVSTITKLAFALLGKLLESGLKLTMSVFELARKILVVFAFLLVILHLFSKLPDLNAEVQPYLAPCVMYMNSMLTTIKEMTAKDVVILTVNTPGTLIETKDRMLSKIMAANPSEIATEYTSELWTLLKDHVQINDISNVNDIITQIKLGKPIVTLKEGPPVLTAEVIIVIQLMKYVLSQYLPRF
jgi:hypothetical protein